MNSTNSKKIIILFLALLFAIPPIVAQMQTSTDVLTQTQDNSPSIASKPQIIKPETPKISPELEAKLVALLKETGKDSASLSLPENRIRYQSAAADMLWTHDPKTARDLFASASNDLRGLVQALDAIYQRHESGEDEDESLGSMFFGGGRGVSGKFYTTNTIRQNLLKTLAKRDGNAALALFRETQRDNFKAFGWNDGQFESQLGSIIAKNDPARAFEIGMQKLSKSNLDGIDELIANLYQKDADKGAKLAAETVKKLLSANPSSTNNDRYNYYGGNPLNSVFSKAAESAAEKGKAAGKTPMLSDSDLSQLAELIIKKRSDRFEQDGDYYDGSSNNEYLKKYAPASYARFERETNKQANSNSAMSNRSVGYVTSSNANIITTVNGNVSSNVAVRRSTAISARQTAEEARSQAQSEALSKLTEAATSPDGKISLEEARKNLSLIRNRQQKLFALAQIVKAFITHGDKDSAKALLADVAEMQSAQPRKAAEMLQNLMLADAYSGIEPERAFVIMESTILEFNSVTAALNRMIDFADIKEIADGEFNMGMIPVEATESLGVLGLREPLFNLATADFERTAALADKFDRPELRMEAKMLFIRTLLPPGKDQ